MEMFLKLFQHFFEFFFEISLIYPLWKPPWILGKNYPRGRWGFALINGVVNTQRIIVSKSFGFSLTQPCWFFTGFSQTNHCWYFTSE